MSPSDRQHQRLAMEELAQLRTDNKALRAALDRRATSAAERDDPAATVPACAALREQVDAQQFRLLTLRAEHQALQNNKVRLEGWEVRRLSGWEVGGDRQRWADGGVRGLIKRIGGGRVES